MRARFYNHALQSTTRYGLRIILQPVSISRRAAQWTRAALRSSGSQRLRGGHRGHRNSDRLHEGLERTARAARGAGGAGCARSARKGGGPREAEQGDRTTEEAERADKQRQQTAKEIGRHMKINY
ncbi:hypothetical protein BASA60_006524 [Batrachochytrium salamandrivorans]|nr:hypothetical protein BASA60_006524 [Batrachochytrium salamandrivorans]